MVNEVLGIIPAKGLSKGLPNKNLYHFCGKPLVQWAIEVSMRSRHIVRTVVSSDSNKILRLSRKLMADVIERPAELATDIASNESVIEHTVNYLSQTEGYRPDVLVLLQPTSPLRTCEDSDRAMELYFESGCSAVISGYELERNPLEEFLINDEGRLTAIMDDKYPFLPRQQLPRAFRPNGAIYIVKAELFMETHCLLTDDTKPFFMDKQKSIDIDTIEDLKAAAEFNQRCLLNSQA